MACKGTIYPEKLPPTQRSCYFHGLRVHFQIMKWIYLEGECSKKARDWGWKQDANTMSPITTDLDVAPTLLKKVIRCKCKITSTKFCDTKLCTCRKYGLPCLPSCSGCRGEECNNRDVSILSKCSKKEPNQHKNASFCFTGEKV